MSDTQRKLADLRADLVVHRNALAKKYSILPAGDPRKVVARHMRAVVSSSYLSQIFADEYLCELSWWKCNFDQVPPSENIRDEIDDYATLIAASCVVYSLSLFEAGLRRLVRAIDPVVCSNATGSFKSVYNWLLGRLRDTGWKFSLGNAAGLLDLYRTVRNTLHNNGSFHSPSRQDAAVAWRGITYKFQHAQPASFIDWEFNVMLIRDLSQLNREIMEAPLISALPTIS